MTWNPDAFLAHTYILTSALVTGLTFGSVYAFIPLAVGMLLLLVTA